MRNSRVRDIWSRGEVAYCMGMVLKDPAVAELMSICGVDCLWLDLEHHAIGIETAEQLIRATRVGDADVMARPAKGEFMQMGRLLEAGAQGILYPRCESAEEAREVVRWAKFAPVGERGFDGANPDARYGLVPAAHYATWANKTTFVAVQVESPNAVPRARAMAEVEGVDMVFFGPGDYSVLSGVPGKPRDPRVLEAMKRTCEDTLAAGKHFGTLAFDWEHAKTVQGMGGTFVAYGSDVTVLKEGVQGRLDGFQRTFHRDTEVGLRSAERPGE